MIKTALVTADFILLSDCVTAESDTADSATASVNDLMTSIITPASNTLWGVEEPPAKLSGRNLPLLQCRLSTPPSHSKIVAVDQMTTSGPRTPPGAHSPTL